MNHTGHPKEARQSTSRLMRLFIPSFTIMVTALTYLWPIKALSESGPEKAQYVKITPAITTNYLAPKLKYVQADVAIKVRGNSSVSAIESHIPRIKHKLILILSQQEFEGVSTQDGRTIIKELALEEINNIMDEEGLAPNIEEVLFTRFIVE